MFKKLVDLLRQVFWLKKSSRRRSSPKPAKKTRPVTKTAKKKVVKQPSLKKVPVEKLGNKVSPKIKAPKLPYDPSLSKIGEITHYFERIKVCVIKITSGTILIGDRLTIASKTSAFVQKVWSMQIESQDVKVAKKGQLIGIKVDRSVTVGDIVLK